MSKNKTRYAVLGMLSISPMSGYEISQTIQESIANFWAESDGQLYPTLAKLTKEKLITCKLSETEGERAKKIYTITAKGLDELKKWLATSDNSQSIRNELLLKIFFGANVAQAITREQILAHQIQAKTMLQQLNTSKEQLTKEYKTSTHLPYWLMTISYGITMTEAKIAWCDQMLKTFEVR